jgi:hypothetical protein
VGQILGFGEVVIAVSQDKECNVYPFNQELIALTQKQSAYSMTLDCENGFVV